MGFHFYPRTPLEKIGTATELDAVNEILAAIGEDPVENLEMLPPSGNTALLILRNTNTNVQAEGHWFNSEQNIVFHPNANDKEIFLPHNVLGAVGVEVKCIKRGNQLYDKENKTYKFEKAVNCDIVYQLPWEELPNSAQRYITALATEHFIDGMPAEIGVTEARKRALYRAKAAFEQDEVNNEKYNLLDNETISGLMRRS